MKSQVKKELIVSDESSKRSEVFLRIHIKIFLLKQKNGPNKKKLKNIEKQLNFSEI